MNGPFITADVCKFDQNPALVKQMLKFRKTLFIDQLGWDLEVSNDEESDEFDNEDTTYCVLRRKGVVVGGFRALRTDTPYLAQCVFPHLAVEGALPNQSDVWEISRFGVTPRLAPGRLSLLNYAALFQFAKSRHAKALVALVDVSHERHLSRLGIRTRRYGIPTPIGQDAKGQVIHGVVGEIPLHGQNPDKIEKILKLVETMEMKDDAFIFGCERISA